MSSTTVYPNGDGTKTGWTNDAGGTSNLYSSVSEGTASPNDSNYIQTFTPNNPIFLLLGDMPSDFGTATAVTIKVRSACSFAKSDWIQSFKARLVQSNESTAITAETSDTSVTETIATFSASPSITGATDKSTWDGARIKITSGAGGSGGVLYVYAIQVEITYTAAASGGLFTVNALSGLGCSGPKNFNRLERSRPQLWLPRRPQIFVPAMILGA